MLACCRRLLKLQREVIKESLPVQRKRQHSLRAIADAILWYPRVGSLQRNLLKYFPRWPLVHYYFRKQPADASLKKLTFKSDITEIREIPVVCCSSITLSDLYTRRY